VPPQAVLLACGGQVRPRDWTQLSGRATVYNLHGVSKGYPGLPAIHPGSRGAWSTCPDAPGTRLVSNVAGSVDPAGYRSARTDRSTATRSRTAGLWPRITGGGLRDCERSSRERREGGGKSARREASEFFTSMAARRPHDGRAIAPRGRHYKCWLLLRGVAIEAPTRRRALN